MGLVRQASSDPCLCTVLWSWNSFRLCSDRLLLCVEKKNKNTALVIHLNPERCCVGQSWIPGDCFEMWTLYFYCSLQDSHDETTASSMITVRTGIKHACCFNAGQKSVWTHPFISCQCHVSDGLHYKSALWVQLPTRPQGPCRLSGFLYAYKEHCSIQ